MPVEARRESNRKTLFLIDEYQTPFIFPADINFPLDTRCFDSPALSLRRSYRPIQHDSENFYFLVYSAVSMVKSKAGF